MVYEIMGTGQWDQHVALFALNVVSGVLITVVLECFGTSFEFSFAIRSRANSDVGEWPLHCRILCHFAYGNDIIDDIAVVCITIFEWNRILWEMEQQFTNHCECVSDFWVNTSIASPFSAISSVCAVKFDTSVEVDGTPFSTGTLFDTTFFFFLLSRLSFFVTIFGSFVETGDRWNSLSNT